MLLCGGAEQHHVKGQSFNLSSESADGWGGGRRQAADSQGPNAPVDALWCIYMTI